MKNHKICAIIGETPAELPFGYDEDYHTCAEMKYKLVTAIQGALAKGFDSFASTAEQGASMWGAEAVSIIKNFKPEIGLLIAPTSESQADRWHPERRERYFNLLEAADEVIPSTFEVSGEDYLFENSDRIIILGDSCHERIASAIKRADEMGIEVIHI